MVYMDQIQLGMILLRDGKRCVTTQCNTSKVRSLYLRLSSFRGMCSHTEYKVFCTFAMKYICLCVTEKRTLLVLLLPPDPRFTFLICLKVLL